ncbi:hypothetical protein [Saccharothrix australiensis]|uniref:Extradiol ring-cleavage dioxygenase LigAB LigA subunit domain-containing protein n=1 Tax=Saccharothrix australiensis TaxID=2072 RepID=A0A495VW73_9PSEU|nr:hypothetical protein [Saccharothrix australiensis]RKT53622.1 hypothetical protein C8E97_2194 [Saccharothrix australiensis]
MSAALATFMEELALDPVRRRAFQADRHAVLAESDLDDEQRAVLAGGDIGAINALLSQEHPDPVQRSTRGALALVVLVVATPEQ